MSVTREHLSAVYGVLINRAADSYRDAAACPALDTTAYLKGKAQGYSEAADLLVGLIREHCPDADDLAVAALAEARMQIRSHARRTEPWL